MEKEEKIKKRVISIETAPNGYSLKVGKDEFMYFNELDLLAGFMVHVGCHEEKPMEGGMLMSTLLSALIGHEYSDMIENVTQRMAFLTTRQAGACKDVDEMSKYIASFKPKLDGFGDRIKDMDTMVKTAARNYAEIIAPVTEAKGMMDSLSSRMSKLSIKIKSNEEVVDSLQHLLGECKAELIMIRELRSDLEKANKTKNKTAESTEAKDVDDVKAKKKKADSEAEKKPRKTSRKANDEKILRALEEEKKKGNLK